MSGVLLVALSAVGLAAPLMAETGKTFVSDAIQADTSRR
jgi:hypothetical protein